MRRGKKKGRVVRSVRQAIKRKVMRQAPKEGSVEKTAGDRIAGLEKGKGRKTAAERCIIDDWGDIRVYNHQDLQYLIVVRDFDYFTSNSNLLR